MILYRPVGLQELELIYDSGMKAFPARLPQQPIFYPVLQLEYARQIASDWNVKNGQFAGYVTEFKVEDPYISKFEKHTVGGSQHQEFWIPAEEMEEFNKHISGHIKVVEAHFGDAFRGFVPDKFGLQGKNAVEQFTLLANSLIYKRMDFYLELKRNHKAVFLNYPYWQKCNFKNPGLKEKVIQAIKEAWLTSFPQIPLPLPPQVQEDSPPVKQTPAHTQRWEEAAQEDVTEVDETDAYSFEEAFHEDITPVEETDSPPFSENSPERWSGLGNPAERRSIFQTSSEDVTPTEETDSDSLEDLLDEDDMDVKQPDTPTRSMVNPDREDRTPVKQIDSHFVQGIKLSLGGNYQEAIGELSKAVAEDSDHVVAHTSLGVAFHRLGEDGRALSCYETALKLDPIYAEAHYFRSNILYSQGNVQEAIAGYTVAIGLEPELIEAHQKPAPQDRLTDYTDSPAEIYRIAKPAYRILDLNKSLEANPGQADLFKERAAEYYRLRNYVQAIADYSSYLAIRPDDASVLHLRGVAYEQLGQFDRAQDDYQRAIVLNPRLSDEYINRGVNFGQIGNLRQAIANLTDAIRLAPKNPYGYFNRGTAFLQQGDFERAIDDFSNVIRLSPEDEEAYYWRGISNEQAGRQQEAIADYRQFLALSQDQNARAEIEQKLRTWREWNQRDRNRVSDRSVIPNEGQKTNRVQAGKPESDRDLYGLLIALGERALHSTWFGSGVNCYGEKAEELYAFTDQNKPIAGQDFLHIAAGIRQTMKGDFQAFDPGATSPWIFLRAWEGSGFYVETNDPNTEKQLKTYFQAVEEVEGVSPPYKGLFIRI
jgi:tetratricopeptide (TPR) repeat protein